MKITNFLENLNILNLQKTKLGMEKNEAENTVQKESFPELSSLLNAKDEESVLLLGKEKEPNKESALGDKIRASVNPTSPQAKAATLLTSSSTTTKNGKRVYNSDGSSYIKNKKGNKNTTIKYDANGKRTSKKVVQDGVTATSTYSYNKDGSYSVLTKTSGKTTEIKYDKNGKKVSAESKDKKGNEKTYAYKYNNDGSYTMTVTNKKTGGISVTEYNTSGKRVSTVNKKQVKNGTKVVSEISYEYNSDGQRTSAIKKNSKGKTIKSETYKYNSDGTLASKTKNLPVSKKKTTYSYKYKTDGSYQKTTKTKKKGKLVKTVVEKFNSECKRTDKTVKKYDANGNLIK